MSTIEIGAGVESAEANGALVEGPRVLWRAGEDFQSHALRQLFSEARAIRHPAFGSGWKIEGGCDSLWSLQLYPICRLARVWVEDASSEPQVRQYVLDRLSADTSGEAPRLIIASHGRARHIVVVLEANGELAEFHRKVPVLGLPSDRLIAPSHSIDSSSRPTVTVDEAAELRQLHPTTIRKLLRAGTLPGTKLGRDWIVDRDAILTYKPSNRGLWRQKGAALRGDGA